MNRHGKVLVSSLFCLIATAANAQTANTLPRISASEARATLVEAARYAQIRHWTTFAWEMLAIDVSSVQVSPTELRIDASKPKKPPLHLRLALKATDRFGVSCDDMDCWLTLGPYNQQADLRDDSQRGRCLLLFGTNGGFNSHQRHLCARAENKEECEHSGERFAAALNALKRSPLLSNFNPDAFRQQAAAWRALPTKPPLAPEAGLRRSLAEDAIKNNQPGEALRFYDEGLSLDPTWAQGWFNAALIAAQLNYYADAALYMRNYLELAPDAQDAQAAREQIAVWDYKAKNR
jgi:tetratricopeptide (TPR) repeat protein